MRAREAATTRANGIRTTVGWACAMGRRRIGAGAGRAQGLSRLFASSVTADRIFAELVDGAGTKPNALHAIVGSLAARHRAIDSSWQEGLTDVTHPVAVLIGLVWIEAVGTVIYGIGCAITILVRLAIPIVALDTGARFFKSELLVGALLSNPLAVKGIRGEFAGGLQLDQEMEIAGACVDLK